MLSYKRLNYLNALKQKSIAFHFQESFDLIQVHSVKFKIKILYKSHFYVEIFHYHLSRKNIKSPKKKKIDQW